jgi:hypothetical protein
MLNMLDATDMAVLSGQTPDALAGYVTGPHSSFPTYDPMVRENPRLAAQHRIISIAPQPFLPGRCLDMEPQDAIVQQFPGWHATHFVGGGFKAVAYTMASMMQGLINVLSQAGLSNDVWLWSAHYTHTPHVCGPGTCGFPQAHMTQWTDRFDGRNLDASEVPPEVFELDVTESDFHYERYPNQVFDVDGLSLNEHDTVVEYDNRTKSPVVGGSENALRIQEVLRPHLRILRDRLMHIATVLDSLPNGDANWNPDFRGWRWQRLNERFDGKKVST